MDQELAEELAYIAVDLEIQVETLAYMELADLEIQDLTYTWVEMEAV
mgnify:CR=1 FL=1